jgi:hypothetical protein
VALETEELGSYAGFRKSSACTCLKKRTKFPRYQGSFVENSSRLIFCTASNFRQVGDILMRQSLHHAQQTDYDPTERRLMKRATVMEVFPGI